MTPPVDPAPGQTGPGNGVQPALSFARPLTSHPQIDRMRQRADFLRAAQARRQGTAGFLLQARERRPGETPGLSVRIGFTCSKKIGNAVLRNRAKRRLRALAQAVFPELGIPGWDYVMVGRPNATVSHPFAAMQSDLRDALTRVHKRPPAP